MKNQLFKITFISLGAIFLLACSKKESLNETFIRINQEVLQNSKAYSTLKEATSTIGHRLTGSENGKKAEEYTFNKFKEYGFDDVKFQEFEVEAWSRGDVSVTIDGAPMPAVTLGHSPIAADIAGEIVDMGNGLEVDYEPNPNAAKDKIVLIFIDLLEGSKKELRNLHRSEKTAIAISHGAKGVIIFNKVDKGVLLGCTTVFH